MKNVYSSLRKFVLGFILSLVTVSAISQPVHYQGYFNGSYTDVPLTDLGDFRQYRHASTASSTSDQWAFRNATSSGWWSDNQCLSLGIPSYNQVIVPSSPKTYGFAEYTINCYDFLPAVTNGYYYTFNITEKSTSSTPVNEDMAVLETSYNPVSISAVSKSPSSPNSVDTVTVTATTSASLSTGEYLYLRYSTSSTFSTSTVVAFNMSGTSGTAKIPPQAGGSTIYYYVFSSNRTSSQLATSVSTYGQVSYNLLTLNLNNNSTSNYSYTVSSCATAPTGITSSVAGCLKSGRSTTLTRVGGTLPSGGSFKWYEGGCGAGASIGTGNSITVSPTTSTIYYVRAEDGCGNTVCATYNVIVGDSSLPSIAITSEDSGCLGVKMKFKRSGGSLGSSAQWSWYRNACGGTGTPALGNGDSITVFCNLGLNTIYLRAEGQCNNTSCITKTIYIRDSSVRPSNDSLAGLFCVNKPVTMSASTGSLGFNSNWKWYSGSCGGTLVGTGNTLTVTPTAPGVYTYYRRAEGTCNTTVCAVHKFKVQDTSMPATSISGPTSVCEQAAPLVFKPIGGSLSSGASWTWSRIACSGSPGQIGLGSGDSLVLTTADLGVGTHTIFVKGINGCNVTNCVSTTITISDTSMPASSISGTSTICLGQSSTLTFSGGKLGAGASWKWYEGSCGGTSVGTGTSYVASPTAAGTYTYYLRAEGTCNNTICRSFTLTVRDSSIPASSVSASATTICLGQSVNFNLNGGSLGHGASWKWYTGSCGGTSLGTGSNLTWGPPSSGSITVYGRAEGTCNNTICKSITITVRDTAIPATSISSIDSGCQGVTVKLKRVGGSLSPGSTWNWYRNGCATSGIPWLGSGDSITIQLSNGWNYIYLTATGGLCNVPKCATKNVFIRDTSVRPNNDSMAGLFCLAKPVTMNASTGTLGFGATAWKWYSGSCGGTLVGSGNTLTVTPATPGVYTYYRRAEGYCNTTVCAVHKFRVQDSSKTPTSISGPTSVCERSSALVFKPVGGNMSSSGTWSWSRVACNGSPGQIGLGSGDSLVLTTAALGVGTHTIYIKGLNGCNTTNCVSKTITISDTSVPASSISGTSTICLGQSSTLTFSGGKLGAGGSWKWYEGSCGGTSIATGSSYVASPAVAGTYTYYLRAEGTCNNTLCKSFTLTVRDTSVPAASVSGTKTTFCLSDTSLLTLSGGSLGTGASWKWYVNSCSGISIGSGTSHIASPNQGGTYTYYVRAEGTCNNTVCKTITLTVRDTSVPANSISGTSTICKGQSSTLTLNGGNLGTGGNWKWYLGSCSGTSVATGNSFTASPASAGTYTYYVRAEGTCNTTACRSFTLTVNDTSTPATSATATSTTICKGQSTTLSKNGGSLGTGATWEWYSGSCTGTPVGSGSSLSVTPTTTTTYYIKAAGTCNNTACQSVTITVRDTSVPAVNISGTTTICKGQNTTFTLNGGSLGTGGSWKWYSGSCGGTSAGSGTTLTVSPAAGTYTYYVRAEGTCNNTVCKSVTLTVNDTSVPATSVTATSTTICKGQSTTLSKNGGSLGTGATWEWYSGSCTGTPVGSGSSLTVTPTTTTTYFVKAEGTCNNTACQSVTITVRDTSVPATVVTGTASIICKGESVTLTLNGGSLGTGGSWKWYSGSCGGTSAGTGTSVTLSPQSTTTYYVRAEGTCNNTLCKSYTVTVRDTSVPASSISGTSTICKGQSTTLNVSGGTLGTGGSWKWYTSSCGGTSAGTGTSLSVTPNTTTTYYVRAEGTCNNTVCKSVTVTVNDTNIAPSSISGPTSVCQRSAALVFKVVGGTLSPGASWNWSRVACSGNPGQVGLGSGDSISYTTASLGVGTHTIFVKAVGGCNTSNCVSKTITISDTSVPASSISGTSTICLGQSTTLSINGGKLGAGGSWKWYSGSCGGTSVGTGSTFTASPTAAGTYTYYARAEGNCNNTTCQSFTITVRDSSVPATSISGNSTICLGQSSTFTLSGGSLGTGGSWKWYNGSCGGTSVATGTTLTVTPAAGTYTYYVRAEGTCNNTACRSITLTVRDSSVPATSISGTSTICKGQSSTLTLNGGSLGTGGTWKWYLGSCSGSSVATGTSYTASPASAGIYTYYVRAEGTCNTTVCRSFTLTVNDTSTPVTSISGTSTLCKGQSTTLTVSGGSLGTGGSLKWYTSSCGGTSVGTGTSLSVTPNTSITYYVRAEGTCNNTVCKSVTVTVRDTSEPAITINAADTTCDGKFITFTVVGGKKGHGATWNWYRTACGGSGIPWMGSGDTLKVKLSPGNHDVYLRAQGTCNTTKCVNTTVTVVDTSVKPSNVTANAICLGSTATLSVSGGKLGYNSQWKWYSTCGGTALGTGSTLSVTPTAIGTYTYYVRAEGPCNNTGCATVSLTVRDTSKPASSISGPSSVCQRSASIVLKPIGGNLSQGASWTWTKVACHGSSGQVGLGSGDSLTLTTAALGTGTHTIYLKAINGCNSTVCVTKTITVNDTGIAPSAVSASPSTICVGETSTLSVSGGQTGSNGSWKWYTTSCGVALAGTGSSITVSPGTVGTNTYYVRAEATCGNTICKTVVLTVRDTSQPVVSISGNNTICQGTSTSLSTNGGSLASGAAWKWYSGSCGGTSLGTGSSISVTPSATTTYFVRAEGTCKNSPCKSVVVSVRDTSKPATSITGTTTVCKGSSTTLSVNGGTLGFGASWKWYSGSCAGTAIGTGSSIAVSPAANTTYFVRAESSCNNTVCRSVNVTVQDTSIPGLFISGNTTICRGQSNTFTLVGGTLGTGATWKWYNSSCGIGSVGSGTTLTVSPTIAGSYTYYVRAEGNCGNSACINITLTVRDTSTPASSISGTSTICKGQSTTLSVVGGSLGHGASWKWYQGSCLGSFAGTGSSLTLTNLAPGSYTYYVRAEGTCNTTICRSISITVRDTSTPATSIIGTSTICKGQSSTLTLTGGNLGTGGSWKWYEGSCGGTSVGTGVSITVAPAPGTYTYYARAEGLCNNTICQTFVLTMRDSSVPATSVNGTLSTLCVGQSTTLSVNGGSLGTNASWKWYLGSCGFNTAVNTGSSFVLNPTVAGTYTYYVRAEGTCNTTICRSFTITVRDTSVAPSAITGTATLCQGQQTTLAMTGGYLGTGATWKWYLGSCGGTAIATGVTSLTVSPASAGTYTYFVRAEGTCNNSVCRSFTVTMRDTSGKPISISGPDTVCEGLAINLSRNGGVTGTGATWNWYRNACGGSGVPYVGNGNNISVKMGSGEHYFYLKADGVCNTTACVMKKVVVVDSSIRPGNSNEFFTTCLGNKRTLTVNGGRLGYKANWKWYATCGGTVLATGPSLTVTPTAPGSYTYYVRAEGPCNTTPCAAITFTVIDSSKPATAISGPLSVCPDNTPFTLKRVGGSLSPGATWTWSRVACSGSPGQVGVGSGDSIVLTPLALGAGTHVFFIKAIGGCNPTACTSFTMTVRQAPAAPSAIKGSINICKGQSTTLSVDGGVKGTDANWTWYSGSCGGTPVGTGTSIVVAPTDTTQYFVRSEGPCGITACASVRVDVIQTPAAPVAITANYNQACSGTPVKLYANGPALLNGETRHWYINNGGTLTAIGTGDSITVTLSTTSDIELRTENRCFNSASVTKQISILNSPVGTWVGVKNNSWHESDNWCGGIPTATTDVVIPSGTPNQPVITASAQARNLTINSGADLSIASSGNLNLNGSFTKSGTFTSAGKVAFRSGGAVTADGFVTRDLEINLPGEVTLNGNVTVNGNLVLGNGSVITGSYEVNVTNNNANAVVSTGANNSFRSGWIAGNLRRSIKAVDSTYHFPVGSIAEGNNAEFINHNVAGVSSVLAHFRPKPGNDVGLNVFETATANPYGSVSNGGVWYLEPNGGITSGNFDLKLWFHNQATFTAGLVDNSFSILNRPASSTLATDWTKPATNSTYVAGTVSSGYVQRNGINIMGQFGMGITLYPVSVKNTSVNNQIKIMPNPFNATFNVKLDLNAVNNITVKVFDQAGRLVVQRNAGKMSGSETVNVDAASLPEGIYTVVIEGTEGKLMTSKLLKIKQ